VTLQHSSVRLSSHPVHVNDNGTKVIVTSASRPAVADTRRGAVADGRFHVVICLLAAIVAAPAQLRAQHVPEDFVISLERAGGCHAPCPMYSVTIDAHGVVSYQGTMFVRLEGRVTDRIDMARVRALLSAVERIGFFDLRDQYVFVRRADGTAMTQTGLQKTIVTVTHDGRTKRIEATLGAPDGLRELQEQIDRAARTQRWVRIDVATLQEMMETGHLPSPDELGRLLRSALYADEVDVIEALLVSGADVNRLPGDDHQGIGPTRPLLIVRSAAAARALITAGADVWAPDDYGQTPMMKAADVDREVAGVLLKAGAAVDMIDREGNTALVRAARSGNTGVVRLLLSAGANPAYRAPWGTALDLARQAQESERRWNSLPPEFETRPFGRDFDGVIAALEQALAARRR
jgi:hypothetical protein